MPVAVPATAVVVVALIDAAQAFVAVAAVIAPKLVAASAAIQINTICN